MTHLSQLVRYALFFLVTLIKSSDFLLSQEIRRIFFEALHFRRLLLSRICHEHTRLRLGHTR